MAESSGVRAGKAVVISKCAAAGITIQAHEIDAICDGDGGYEIDGMPWDEWLDAQMMD